MPTTLFPGSDAGRLDCSRNAFVCANIVLIPVWWIVGLVALCCRYFLLLSVIAFYEWWQHCRELRQRLSLPEAAFAHLGAYQLAKFCCFY